jgi:hypothetical protein
MRSGDKVFGFVPALNTRSRCRRMLRTARWQGTPLAQGVLSGRTARSVWSAQPIEPRRRGLPLASPPWPVPTRGPRWLRFRGHLGRLTGEKQNDTTLPQVDDVAG